MTAEENMPEGQNSTMAKIEFTQLIGDSKEYDNLEDALGEPTTEADFQHLLETARTFATRFIELSGKTPDQLVVPGLIHAVATFLQEETPFFNQGVGVNTLPGQLKALQQYQEALATGGASELQLARFKLNTDCKLSTALCAGVLQEIYVQAGANTAIQVLLREGSGHPSLLIQEESGRNIKVDYITVYTEYQATALEINVPNPHRLKTYSKAQTYVVPPERFEQYKQYPYKIEPFSAATLAEVDRVFLDE